MSRFRGFALCLIAGLLPAVALPSLAQSGPAPSAGTRLPCHDYQRIVETLDKRYGETPVSLGVQTNGHVLQVFASASSGSWTILTVAPTGIGCIIAAGRNWHQQKPQRSDPAT